MTAAGLSLPALAGSPREARPRDEGSAVELGRRLFFDPVVSRTGRRSCASCHDPERAFSVPEKASDDDMGPTRRRSQTLVDVYRAPRLHSDGEFASIEELVEARIGLVRTRQLGPYHVGFTSAVLAPGSPEDLNQLPDPDDRDRGFGSHPLDLNLLPDVARTVERGGRYAEGFRLAFGTTEVSTERIAEAIGAYARTIRSGLAPVDRHLAGDPSLDASARRGLELFRGRAGCVRCHLMEANRPSFSDQEFHDTGVAWRSIEAATEPGTRPFDADRVRGAEAGRASVTTASTDRRAFRTPTLRDVARRGPFMHDGSIATLEDVVRHYARGGTPGDDRQDPRIRPFDASEDDVADLVAFLRSLTSERRPGLAPVPWRARAERTRLRLVDARGRALAGWPVSLVPEGDVLPVGDAGAATEAVAVVTDAEGRFEAPASARTHLRLVLPDGLEPEGGPLVPDTCRAAVVVVPVAGRAAVLVDLPPGTAPPKWVDAMHEGAMRLPGDPEVRTILSLVGRVKTSETNRALYEGWVRTDLPSEVAVVLPGDRPGTGRPVRLDAAGRPADLSRVRPRPVAGTASVGEARTLDPRARGDGAREDDPVRLPRAGSSAASGDYVAPGGLPTDAPSGGGTYGG